MAESISPKPNKPNPPKRSDGNARKPLQVMHISRKTDPEPPSQDPIENEQVNSLIKEESSKKAMDFNPPTRPFEMPFNDQKENLQGLEEPSMGDLLALEANTSKKVNNYREDANFSSMSHSVDDFDFDENAFLAALDENEPVGITGETAKGKVIGVESDGVYVDIGGKAPGFMPKKECALGVITNLKELFPKGHEVEVLVTREQNADGMVTISCRALALRKSWEKVEDLQKAGGVSKVKINGFNRGGVTCDLEGLRGFIPRSQLEDGSNHDSLVGKILSVAFLEVNPETRKLVLSEKRAVIAAKFATLEIGQLIQGEVIAIKPYGLFIDIGGISGLLHQSMITNGSLRSIREVFKQGETINALITDLDASRGRIGLNTALLEGPPGELLIEKEKVMAEAQERAKKARSTISTQNQSPEDVIK